MVDLTEHGWEEPVDESPFDLPSGWQGGRVVNTGGNIFCRIWKHPETDVEVIYNIYDPGVGVQKQEEPDESIEMITTIDTPSTDDSDKMEVAKEYIQEEFDPSDV